MLVIGSSSYDQFKTVIASFEPLKKAIVVFQPAGNGLSWLAYAYFGEPVIAVSLGETVQPDTFLTDFPQAVQVASVSLL